MRSGARHTQLSSVVTDPWYSRTVTYCCSQSTQRLMTITGTCLASAVGVDGGRWVCISCQPAATRHASPGTPWRSAMPAPAPAAVAAPFMEMSPSASAAPMWAPPSARLTGSSARSKNSCPPPTVAIQWLRTCRLLGRSLSVDLHRLATAMCVTGSSSSGLQHMISVARSSAVSFASRPASRSRLVHVIAVALFKLVTMSGTFAAASWMSV